MIDKFKELMRALIVNICEDLKKSNKSKELIRKYVDNDESLSNKNVKKIKRPLSSYMIFCNEMRSKLMSKYPKSGVGEISKKLGKLWKALNFKDREKYDRLHEKEQNRYRNELKQSSKTCSGLLSENSLSVSYINNDSDDSESDNSNNVEDLDKSDIDKSSKNSSQNNSESSSEDEEDDDDEICDLPSNKKKFNITDINTDMNSIYLDSD